MTKEIAEFRQAFPNWEKELPKALSVLEYLDTEFEDDNVKPELKTEIKEESVEI